MNLVVVGMQWGDEGKGKVVDFLSETADVIIRYQGGHNAGHTVVIEGQTIILHLIPTGLLHAGKIGVIGHGVVVDPKALLDEIEMLASKGISVTGRLFLSDAAHLVMPYHRTMDHESEQRRGASKIGTTGRGIGPAYADKMARVGIRVADLLDPQHFREKLSANLTETGRLLPTTAGEHTVDLQKIYDEYLALGERIKPYIAGTARILRQAIGRKQHLLFEGAQGTQLDVDMGAYPYVTSSNATAGGACTGTGVGPTQIDKVIGVAKAYATRVGSGPFPSETDNDIGERLRTQGQEFGATTGRSRRCGWFDVMAARYAVDVNGLTAMVVTKLDILDGFSEIPLCTGYQYKGQLLTEMPTSANVLQHCTPVYQVFDGWRGQTTAGATSYGKLPDNARRYLEAIETRVGCPVDLISTGSDRGGMIIRRAPFVS